MIGTKLGNPKVYRGEETKKEEGGEAKKEK